MALSEEEKVRVRSHLGYLNVAQVATFSLGAPASMETQFIIEGAMQRVLPEAESLLRQKLALCDSVQQQIADNQELLAVSAVGEIAVRVDEFEQLIKRYEWHRNDLANILGVYANPFDKRMAARGINVPVIH